MLHVSYYIDSSIKDVNELCPHLLENCDVILESGYTKPLMQSQVEDIPTIVQTVTLHHVILRSMGELSQFKEGMEALGVGLALKDYPSLLYPYFVHTSDTLTAGMVTLAIVCIISLEPL